MIREKIESLFPSKSDKKKNKFRIAEKDRTSQNCWVDEALYTFAFQNIYVAYSNPGPVAEYYIFNSVEVANEIEKAMNTNNEIERLLLFREIRELSASLGKIGFIENFEDLLSKKQLMKNEEDIQASRKSWYK